MPTGLHGEVVTGGISRAVADIYRRYAVECVTCPSGAETSVIRPALTNGNDVAQLANLRRKTKAQTIHPNCVRGRR